MELFFGSTCAKVLGNNSSKSRTFPVFLKVCSSTMKKYTHTHTHTHTYTHIHIRLESDCAVTPQWRSLVWTTTPALPPVPNFDPRFKFQPMNESQENQTEIEFGLKEGLSCLNERVLLLKRRWATSLRVKHGQCFHAQILTLWDRKRKKSSIDSPVQQGEALGDTVAFFHQKETKDQAGITAGIVLTTHTVRANRPWLSAYLPEWKRKPTVICVTQGAG